MRRPAQRFHTFKRQSVDIPPGGWSPSTKGPLTWPPEDPLWRLKAVCLGCPSPVWRCPPPLSCPRALTTSSRLFHCHCVQAGGVFHTACIKRCVSAQSKRTRLLVQGHNQTQFQKTGFTTFRPDTYEFNLSQGSVEILKP